MIVRSIVLSVTLTIIACVCMADSLSVMPFAQYQALVIQNHPLARQAQTLNEEARKGLTLARGAFDPRIETYFDQKQFNTKEYWQIWSGRLIVPTLPGLDLRAGYDQSSGVYLDNSDFNPVGGLSSFGISVPLGQGLLTDQRRTALQQARLAIDMAEADRVRQINRLLLQTAGDFWNWSFAHYRVTFHEEALRLAEIRFSAIRDRVLLGDLPAIDSLEAFIEAQNRKAILLQSVLERDNARLEAANHLWSDDLIPVLIPDRVIPDNPASVPVAIPDSTALVKLLSLADSTHPELIRAEVRIGQLEADRRWAAERLKPRLSVNYNLLNGGGLPWQQQDYSWTLDDNFNWGFGFSMPLFLREERGRLGVASLKVRQAELELMQSRREIQARVQASRNELEALAGQISIQQQQVLDSERMLSGEQFRFNSGEGSVFLMNTRENALVTARIRLAELQSRFSVAEVRLYWTVGNLIGQSVTD
ncbi:MAG: TolC family protein [Bacteroidota bacterium]